MPPVKIVAIVDDDDIFRFLMQKIINRTHLVSKIEVFRNGREAMDFLEANQDNTDLLPEIILLDLNMPLMDGWEFIEAYKHLKPKLKKKMDIYVLSSSVSAIDMNRIKEISEVKGYVVKPITETRFKEMVRALIEESA